jgi:hypothetical protein
MSVEWQWLIYRGRVGSLILFCSLPRLIWHPVFHDFGKTLDASICGGGVMRRESCGVGSCNVAVESQHDEGKKGRELDPCLI